MVLWVLVQGHERICRYHGMACVCVSMESIPPGAMPFCALSCGIAAALYIMYDTYAVPQLGGQDMATL